MFVPSVPLLLNFAAEMEAERDHVLNRKRDEDGLDDLLLEQAQREQKQPDTLGDELPFQTLEASATFDRVLYDGGEFGTAAAAGSPEEEDFLGLPGLLEPEQVASLLRKRQADQQAAKKKQPKAEPVGLAPHEQIAELRKELNGLVGAWNHRTGQPHGVIHAELRRSCGGPAIAQATADQIRERIAMIRKWAATRK